MFFFYSYIPGDYMTEPTEVKASEAAMNALWYSLIATVCTAVLTYIAGRIIYAKRKTKTELPNTEKTEK